MVPYRTEQYTRSLSFTGNKSVRLNIPITYLPHLSIYLSSLVKIVLLFLHFPLNMESIQLNIKPFENIQCKIFGKNNLAQ